MSFREMLTYCAPSFGLNTSHYQLKKICSDFVEFFFVEFSFGLHDSKITEKVSFLDNSNITIGF